MIFVIFVRNCWFQWFWVKISRKKSIGGPKMANLGPEFDILGLGTTWATVVCLWWLGQWSRRTRPLVYCTTPPQRMEEGISIKLPKYQWTHPDTYGWGTLCALRWIGREWWSHKCLWVVSICLVFYFSQYVLWRLYSLSNIMTRKLIKLLFLYCVINLFDKIIAGICT